MQLSLPLLIAATSLVSTSSFTSCYRVSQKSSLPFPCFAASPLEEVSDPEPSEASADPYQRIGISKDELAIGIEASEFLQWIGTKEELKERFMKDNRGMDIARADEEVSKFLMDAEMANAYIDFEKEKALNPPNLREEAEQSLSDPKTIATYAGWLVGGASFGYIRKEFIEPKYASGEWEELHIQLPFQDLIKPETAAEVVTPDAAISAAKLADSFVAAVDIFQGSIGTSQT